MKRLIAILFLALASTGYGAPAPAPGASALQVGTAPAPPISVSILGPQSPSGEATWEAVVWGGTPPYEYVWMWTNSEGYAEGEFLHANFYSPGIVHVGVRDALGVRSYAYMNVNPTSPP